VVFSSHVFVFYFLPLALLVYYLLPWRGRHLGLTFLSYAFYGWANPKFVFIIFASTTIDYICGLVIARRLGRRAWREPIGILERGGSRTRAQRIALIVSICSNLSILGFFKYFNFGVENYNTLMEFMGLSGMQWESVIRITLPLGISFYTFQSMSYTIDVYRGDARAIRNFTDFACYVSMFPQLVAGPIIRFSEIEEQLTRRTHTLQKFTRGAAFFALGMAKKILLANPCGKIADAAFDAGSLSLFDSWYGVVSYAFQIYFDFSGYSDMAIGLGLMLGFTFPKNFDSPYLACSITEFWRRWHISLSSWLRDYLYVPLGGNRKGSLRTYINLGIVMLLGGLWHGASWNFVIWGGMHGSMLAFERAQGKESLYRRLPRPIRIGITFFIVLITWVFFRASDLPAAVAYLKCMFGLGAPQDGAGLLGPILYNPYCALSFLIAGLVVWAGSQTWDWTKRLTWTKGAICLALFWLALTVLTTQAYNPFIYFIF